MDKKELKKLILEYLSKNRRMTLATSDKNIPWASTVMFAYDDNLNFYIISRPDTRKIQNLMKNPLVSIAVNEYIEKKGYIMGLQGEGEAELLNKESNKKELDLYRARFDLADDYLHDHELYKIKPEKVYYLDDELFGPGGREELEL